MPKQTTRPGSEPSDSEPFLRNEPGDGSDLVSTTSTLGGMSVAFAMMTRTSWVGLRCRAASQTTRSTPPAGWQPG